MLDGVLAQLPMLPNRQLELANGLLSDGGRGLVVVPRVGVVAAGHVFLVVLVHTQRGEDLPASLPVLDGEVVPLEKADRTKAAVQADLGDLLQVRPPYKLRHQEAGMALPLVFVLHKHYMQHPVGL